MRQKSIVLSARNIMGAVAKNMYVQAPIYKPRNGGVILEKLQEFLITTFHYTSFGGYEFPVMVQENETDFKAVENFLRKILLVIPEFEQLNITEAEYEAGIRDVNDPRREDTMQFVDRYTPSTTAKDDSWKQDFVDLDALIRNIANDLLSTEDSDCFCCVRSGMDICEHCIRNENLDDFYFGSRNPKGKYKHSCYTDCPYNLYICCAECTKDEHKDCQYRCNESVQPCSKAYFIDGNPTEEYTNQYSKQYPKQYFGPWHGTMGNFWKHKEIPEKIKNKNGGTKNDSDVQHMDSTGMPVQPKTDA